MVDSSTPDSTPADLAQDTPDGDPNVGASRRPTLLDVLFRNPVIVLAFAVAGIAAVPGVFHWARHIRDVPWELREASPRTVAIGSTCSRFLGGRFLIELNDVHYWCTGADSKCGSEGAIEIAYDPDAPAQCRVAANVDGLSRYEWLALVLCISGLLAGGALASYQFSRLTERQTLQAKLRHASAWCLALTAIMLNVSGVLVLLIR